MRAGYEGKVVSSYFDVPDKPTLAPGCNLGIINGPAATARTPDVVSMVKFPSGAGPLNNTDRTESHHISRTIVELLRGVNWHLCWSVVGSCPTMSMAIKTVHFPEPGGC